MRAERYVVVKASGSSFARVIDTEMNKVLAKYNILKRDQWELAKKYCARLNAAVAPVAEDDDDHTCPYCAGTGEGATDSARCGHCKGRG